MGVADYQPAAGLTTVACSCAKCDGTITPLQPQVSIKLNLIGWVATGAFLTYDGQEMRVL